RPVQLVPRRMAAAEHRRAPPRPAAHLRLLAPAGWHDAGGGEPPARPLLAAGDRALRAPGGDAIGGRLLRDPAVSVGQNVGHEPAVWRWKRLVAELGIRVIPR